MVFKLVEGAQKTWRRIGWQPHVKGMTIMVNSIFNGNRREDIWLDK
jgi:hypothetical protein